MTVVCRQHVQKASIAPRVLFLRSASSESFVFSPDSFPAPKLPSNLEVLDVPLERATNESLHGLDFLFHDPQNIKNVLNALLLFRTF